MYPPEYSYAHICFHAGEAEDELFRDILDEPRPVECEVCGEEVTDGSELCEGCEEEFADG